MDNIIKQYNHLGLKTLALFILKRCPIVILITVLLLVGLFSTPFVPIDYLEVFKIVILSGFFFLIFCSCLVIFIGWLEYDHYKILISDDSIKISRGILSEEERGIPFRRVKEATVKRNIVDQFFGVSRLILNILGDDNTETSIDETEIILPALEKKIALEIQDIILKKAQVEDVNMETETGLNK